MKKVRGALATMTVVALTLAGASAASAGETTGYRSYSGSQYVDGCRVTSHITSGVYAKSHDNGCARSVGQRIWYIDDGSTRFTPTYWHRHQVTHYVLGTWAYRVSH